MTDDREQLAFKFPPGTRARIDALRLERETLTGAVLRAIAALEAAPGTEPDPKPDSTETRLDRIETRLDRLESVSRQAPAPRYQYDEAVRRRAVEMADSGARTAEIADELSRLTGRAPNLKSLAAQVRQWRVQLAEVDHKTA